MIRIGVNCINDLIFRCIVLNDTLCILIGHLRRNSFAFRKAELRMPYSFTTVLPKTFCDLLHFGSCGLYACNIAATCKCRLLWISNICNDITV